jgi:NTE family protein
MAGAGSQSAGRDKTVSLVLGSGSARGLAHIGVIEWLEQHGYSIQSIAGASMGALIGGIYAAGELDAYKAWVTSLEKADVLRFLDLAFSSEGLFKGDRLMDLLKSMVSDVDIEDLPISYTAVACDVERQREIWLTRGPLFDAIRASIAVPTIFTPHSYKGMKLLDGGLLNPVPIAPTLRDMTDLTVAVNLNGPRRGSPGTVKISEAGNDEDTPARSYHEGVKQFLDKLQNSFKFKPHGDTGAGFFDLLSNSFETMQNAIARIKLATYAPNVIIEIPRDTCTAYEFHRARELIEVGREITGEVMDRYQRERQAGP